MKQYCTIEERNEYNRLRRLAFPEVFRENSRRRRLRHPERVRQQNRESYLRHRDNHAATCKKYFGKHREKILAYQRQYRRDHLKEHNESEYRRYHADIDKSRKYENDRKKLRRRTNLHERILCCLRQRLNFALKCQSAGRHGRTVALLGCPIADFKIYLESKFEPGMSWENYAKVWEIDHIMPCAIFDLTKPEHQKRCFHFSNMQPLPKHENRRKSCKVVSNQFRLL